MTAGYRSFGGGTADVTLDPEGNTTGGIALTVWDAVTGGNQITDLLDAAGNALPGKVTSVTSSDGAARGRISFQSLDVYSVLYVWDEDPAHQRWAVMAREIGSLVGSAIAKADVSYDYMQQLQLGGDTAYAPSLVDGRGVARTFDVQQFGAKGDGATDDTAAVQSAADAAAAAGGGTLTFTAGREYVFNGYATLPSSVTVDGNGATLRKLSGATRYAFFAMVSTGPGYGSGGRDVNIRNFTVRGNLGSNQGACLLAANHADNITIERVAFIMALSSGHGVDLVACRHVTVRDCMFAGSSPSGDNKEAVQADCANVGSGSSVDPPAAADGLPSLDVTVQRCRFLPYDDGATVWPAAPAFGSHSVPAPGTMYRGLRFLDNVVQGVRADTTGYRGALHFVAVDGLRVAGNRFENAGAINIAEFGVWAALDSAGTLVRCRDVTFEANTLTGVTTAESQVRIDRADGVKILDNTGIKVGAGASSSRAVVYVNGSTRLLVRGNDFTAGTGANDAGIRVTADCATGLVADNIVTGFTTNIAMESTTVTSQASSSLPTGFDFTRINPTFVTELRLDLPNVMQGAARDPETGDWYVAQTTSIDMASSVRLSHLSPAGRLIDSMRLLGAGHGSAIGVQNAGGTVYVWLTWETAPTGGGRNHQPVRFVYRPGASMTRNDTGFLDVLPNLDAAPTDYVVITTDPVNDYAAIRVASGGTHTFVRRRMSEWLAGQDIIYGSTPTFTVVGTWQSFASIDDDLYLYSGKNDGSQPHIIRRYSWATGAQTGEVDVTNYGREVTGTYPGTPRPGYSEGFAEPESVCIYRDPATDVASLLFGKTLGRNDLGKYVNWVWAFSPVVNRDLVATKVLAMAANRPVLARVTATTATTTTGWLTAATLTVYVQRGLTYGVMAQAYPMTTVAGDDAALRLTAGGTTQAVSQVTMPRAASAYGATVFGMFEAGTTGPVVFNLDVSRTSGTGNVSSFGNPGQPILLRVKEEGQLLT